MTARITILRPGNKDISPSCSVTYLASLMPYRPSLFLGAYFLQLEFTYFLIKFED